MQINQDYVLILGSKPNSKFPKFKVKKIFSANGAAARVKDYLKIYPNTIFEAIVGSREFEKNLEVQERVIESKPSKIIARSGFVNFDNYNFGNIEKFHFSSNKQLDFQSKFFKFGKLGVIFCESYYEKKIFKKIMHILLSFKKGIIGGASTGLFAILYALYENKDSKIIVSGIGMSGGGHFYKEDTNKYSNRSNVDKKLMQIIKNRYKDRIFTLDKELEKNSKIKHLQVETF